MRGAGLGAGGSASRADSEVSELGLRVSRGETGVRDRSGADSGIPLLGEAMSRFGRLEDKQEMSNEARSNSDFAENQASVGIV